MKMSAIPDNSGLQRFHTRLKRWYGGQGRKALPWRNTADPYRIYLSEVMLQQTQVETVRQRYYEPFLKRFPTLAALAAAPREEILKAWQGLGYYNRAVNLHKAAQKMGDLGLGFGDSNPNPQSLIPSLLSLPGVGKNTAHAIAAFAFNASVPVMEANVKRVLHRVFALEQASTDALWERAEALLDKKNPFDYNQAMMDLGAMVCTRRKPACAACPANGICQGKSEPERYPAKVAKKKIPVRHLRIVVLRDAVGRVYATPRQTRFLHGLYHFPELKREAETLDFGGKILALREAVALGSISHEYSHFRLEAEAAELTLAQKFNAPEWHRLEELKRLPHSRTEEKILKLLA
jgi:A/G-specific adenine glycosylase